MSLKGTLKDFGIADILQLIGQQQKTGVLYIKSKSEEVGVSFAEGQVIRALSKTRKRKELLGTMLVDSGVLSVEELNSALDIQKRTLKRLGDILVTEGKVSAEQLRTMAQLQTTETVYKLFGWNSGNYEFAQQDVEVDPGQGPPMRPESLLMEGFRRVDEWPMVKRRVTSSALTFEKLRPLAPPPDMPRGGHDTIEQSPPPNSEAGVPKAIGRNERMIFQMAEPGITVQRLCDSSQIGEFETQKALYNLMENGFLKPGPIRKTQSLSEQPPKRDGVRFGTEVRRILQGQIAQIGIGLFLFVTFVVAARALGSKPQAAMMMVAVDAGDSRRLYVDTQLSRLTSALELYRLGHGRYPENLSDLVTEHIVDGDELKYPFRTQYHYRVVGNAYVLLPPLN